MKKLIRALVRLVVSALALLLVAFFFPWIEIVGFTNALSVALVVAIIGYIIEFIIGISIKNEESSKFRGVLSFIISAIVIYVTQFIIPALTVSIIGAILVAIIIGIIDAVEY